jgi:hypothetical protein
MDVNDAGTTHCCDNCQTEGPTARLDIGKGVAPRLCAACWARLMAWRQRQNAQKKGAAFAILPWPLAEGEVSPPTGADASKSAQRRRQGH